MQLNRQIIIILVLTSLLISAIATAFYFYNKNKKVLKSNNELVTIYVAKDDIKKNTLITVEHMGKTKIAKKFLLNTPLNKKEILGKYTKETIYKNEMFLKQKLNTKIEEEKSKVLDFSKSSYNMRFDLFNNPNYSIVQGDYINIISVFPKGEPNRQGKYKDFEVQFVANNIKVLGFLRDGMTESYSITKQKVKKLRNKKLIEEVIDVKSDELILDIESNKLLRLIKDYNKGNQLWMVKTKESIQVKTIDEMNKREKKEFVTTNTQKKHQVSKKPVYKLYKPTTYTYKKRAVIDYTNDSKNKKVKNVIVKKHPKQLCKTGQKSYLVGTSSRFHIRNAPSLKSSYKKVLNNKTFISYNQKQDGWYQTCDGLYISEKVVKKVSNSFVKSKLGHI